VSGDRSRAIPPDERLSSWRTPAPARLANFREHGDSRQVVKGATDLGRGSRHLHNGRKIALGREPVAGAANTDRMLARG